MSNFNTNEHIPPQTSKILKSLKPIITIGKFIQLTNLVNSIYDPRTPSYVKNQVFRNRELLEFEPLYSAVSEFLKQKGHIPSLIIKTPQERELLCSTVWPVEQLYIPNVRADHHIFTLDKSKHDIRTKLAELHNTSQAFSSERISTILDLDDGKNVVFTSDEIYSGPKIIVSRAGDNLSVSVKPDMDFETINTARKLELCFPVYGLFYEETNTSLSKIILVSVEPLGSDGNTIRDPRVINKPLLDEIARDDPNLEKHTHAEILNLVCFNYTKNKEDFPYPRE